VRVSRAVTGQIKVGQMEAAVATAAEAASLVGRHGGEVRFFIASASGDQVNQTLFSTQYASPVAMGAAFDAMHNDPELQAFGLRMQGILSPTVVMSTTMAIELPTGHEPKPGRGSILEVHASKPRPGRMQEFLAQGKEICEFVEAHGAVNAQVVQLTFAGTQSGITACGWEVENWTAHAHLGQAWFSDAGVDLQARAVARDAPAVALSSTLLNEVRLS
jgi:hypothetical protein